MHSIFKQVPVAQGIERKTPDLEVGGSNPPRYTI